jgi:hypothetical protein
MFEGLFRTVPSEVCEGIRLPSKQQGADPGA